MSGWMIFAAGFASAIGLMLIWRWRNPAHRRDLLAAPRSGAASPQSHLLPIDTAGEVRQLLAQGRKLEAIKLVRNSTGMGLAEAKDAVEAMGPE